MISGRPQNTKQMGRHSAQLESEVLAPLSGEFIASRPEEILAKLSPEEKAGLLAGSSFWDIGGIPRLGVPSITTTDCGHGVTIVGEETSPATCFPTGIGMASTWNPSLLEEAGQVLGRECLALGCSMLLGPKLNIHRIPLNGRSFETFSEDPWLAGLLGAAVVRGIESVGVAACVKAMTANNQQKDQQSVSAEISELALREIYLRAFELVLRHSKPAAIMTSYNRLNGDFASESRWLIQHVIKDDWGFQGVVLSDWRAVRSESVYNSGLDLEMPGPGTMFAASRVLRAVEEGLITEEQIQDKVERIVRLLLRYGGCAGGKGELDTPRHRAVALQMARESIVLLKNEDDLLPLSKAALQKVLVVGPNAATLRLGGGGSASVAPFYSISPLEGIREICGKSVEIDFVEVCSIAGSMERMEGCFSHRSENGERKPGLQLQFFNGPEPEGEPIPAGTIESLDFSWGWASPYSGVQRSAFCSVVEGDIAIPQSGEYEFGFYAQEGSLRVSFGGQLVVDEWVPFGANVEEAYQTHYRTFKAHYEAGELVPVRIEYGKRAARAALRLEWTPAGSKGGLAEAVERANSADVVVVCAGLSNLLEGGANDRKNIELPPVQVDLIRAMVRANPRTIVVLFNGGPLTGDWIDEVPVLLEAWYPGQEGGRALAEILFGKVEPTGRLPDTIPFRLEDHASAANYPGDTNQVHYREELMVGYRHFDRAGIEPRFPFGFGLGYGRVEIGLPCLAGSRVQIGGDLLLKVEVWNVGPNSSTQVVQVYVEHCENPPDRPLHELRAFQKVTLSPGEHRELHFQLGPMHFERFYPESKQWETRPGRFKIGVGPHSRALSFAEVELSE